MRKWWPLKAVRISLSLRKYNIIKIIGKCKLPAISSMGGAAAAPSGNLIFRPRCQLFASMLCASVNFIITLHYAARALSSPARAPNNIAERALHHKKTPYARFTPERLAAAGCSHEARLLMISREKLPSALYTIKPSRK